VKQGGRRVAVRGRRPSDGGRFAVLLVLLSVLLLAIVGRLVYVQIVAAPVYSAKATAQRMRDIEIPPLRGTVYDREGEPLAESLAARTIYAAPNTVKDKAGTARALAAVLGGSPKTYQAKLSKDSGFVYIARRVDMEKAKKLEALKLKGIALLEDSRRVYPSGTLGAQILGFVGVDGRGLAGIEKRYDGVLAGKAGVLLGERDPYGRPIPGGVQKDIKPVDGHDIVLTIDKDIQFHAQAELEAAVKKWGAKAGSVTIVDPRNGEIYAMASTPVFDPNNYAHADPQAFRNRPVSDAYEPGSTIKSITAAAVIDRGLYTPKSVFHLPPTLRVAGRTIHDAEDRGSVDWSLADIVTNSSNVGAVKLGLKLRKQGLYTAFSHFGLTEATGVDYPGEARGWLPPTKLWSPSSIANIPFGQGLSATPLQLARAVGALANDGMLTTPHFLLNVPADSSYKPSWPTRRACTTTTAHTTTGLLKNVVISGTGKEAAVPGYVVAGKTGTAQVALPHGRGYAKGRYISSFIGYLPADDPQLLIEVKLDEPSEAIFGGVVAAPTFSTLAQFCCDHLKITPTDADSVVVSTPGSAKEASATTGAKRASKGSKESSRRAKTSSAGEVTDDGSGTGEKR
jgi:cell division protein FtsI/penicillin-binding protein 2